MSQAELTMRKGPASPRGAAKLARERRVIAAFMRVYCRGNHRTRRGLCADCQSLLEYAMVRLERCPYDPKPKCKQCPTHCYKPELRARMKQVMKYSGMYYVRHGRLDWLVQYFLT